MTTKTTTSPTHDELMDHLEAAWGVIANAGGWVHGDRTESPSPGWLPAAEQWRDRWHVLLDAYINGDQLREINTPEVRQAISAVVSDELGSEARTAYLTGQIFVILDRASAGLPLDGGA